MVVFANKQPDAWETLVAAIIRAGFCVDGSWPIQTEWDSAACARRRRQRWHPPFGSCARSGRCDARPGWDNVVLEEMRRGIAQSLREFWDAGIRGPDFVWAATGPALEAYSKHPVVKKANDPGQTMSVSEFLRAVRRLVVEFVVGRVLGELTRTAAASVSDAPLEGIAGLDDVTTYYLLHRHDFGMNDAPAGACILYALRAICPKAISRIATASSSARAASSLTRMASPRKVTPTRKARSTRARAARSSCGRGNSGGAPDSEPRRRTAFLPFRLSTWSIT